jgi:hypothetical protein
VTVPELALLAMLAASVVPVVLGAGVALVVPPFAIIARLATVVMPVGFHTVMALIIPPVRIVTRHTVSVLVLFLTLSTLVTAPIIPVSGIATF